MDNCPFEDAQITDVKDREFIVFPEHEEKNVVRNGRTTLLQDRFLTWWNTTSYGSGRNRLPSSLPNRRGLTISLDKIWITVTRGHIWPLFRQIAALDDGEPKVQCTICSAILQHPKATHQGSGSLTRHVQGQHPEFSIASPRTGGLNRTMTDQIAHSTASTPSALKHASQENADQDIRRAFLLFGLAKNLPFNWAEDEVTATLLTRLGLQIRPPGHTQILSELDSYFKDVKSQICHSLKSHFKFSIAIDFWKTANSLNFLPIMVYWIDKNWKFHQALFDAPLLSESATAEEIGKVLYEIFHEHELHTRLLGVTNNLGTDLSGALDVLGRHLEESNTCWNAKDFGLPCLAHAVQLAGNEFCQSLSIKAPGTSTGDFPWLSHVLRASEDVSPANTVTKIRIITRMIASSPLRAECFELLQEEDISTPLAMERKLPIWWIDMYWMITSAYFKREIILNWLEQKIELASLSDLKEKLSKLTITNEEWYHVRIITSILKPLVKLIDVLSESHKPLIHRSLVLHGEIISQLKDKISIHMNSRNTSERLKSDIVFSLQAAVRKIERFYSKIEGQTRLLPNLATILDPTCKLQIYKDWETDENSIAEKNIQIYRREFLDFLIQHYEHSTSNPPDLTLFRDSFQIRRSLEIQALRYLNANTENNTREENDSLFWWRKNEKEFPDLANMARDVLSAPISRLEVKRVFNHGPDIRNYFGGQLDGQAIRKALVINYAPPHPSGMIFDRCRGKHLPNDQDALIEIEDKEDVYILVNREPNEKITEPVDLRDCQSSFLKREDMQEFPDILSFSSTLKKRKRSGSFKNKDVI